MSLVWQRYCARWDALWTIPSALLSHRKVKMSGRGADWDPHWGAICVYALDGRVEEVHQQLLTDVFWSRGASGSAGAAGPSLIDWFFDLTWESNDYTLKWHSLPVLSKRAGQFIMHASIDRGCSSPSTTVCVAFTRLPGGLSVWQLLLPRYVAIVNPIRSFCWGVQSLL